MRPVVSLSWDKGGKCGAVEIAIKERLEKQTCRWMETWVGASGRDVSSDSRDL